MNQSAALHTPEQSSDDLPKGYLFNLLLFLVFVLPIWDIATFKVGSIITNMREVCLVFLPVVYFFYPRRKDSLSIETKYWVVTFFVIIAATAIIKKVLYGLAPFDAVKNFRVTLPVLSGLLIVLQGRKIDPRFCIKTILVAIVISYLLTPLMVAIGVQPSTFMVGGRELQVEYLRNGRFANKNFEFSLLGIALLFYVPQVQTFQDWFKRLIMAASILSILMLILSFNRTMMAAGALLGLVLLLNNLRPKTLGYIALTTIVAGSIAGYFYMTRPRIQRQVDQRILIVFQQEGGLAQSVYYGNRDRLYDTFLDKLDHYWVLGLPGGVSLINNENTNSAKSDISLYNIWIRHGLVALIAFIIVLALIYADQKQKLEWLPDGSLSHQVAKAVIITFPLYVLVSFNIDALVAHNAILFILLFANFYDFKD